MGIYKKGDSWYIDFYVKGRRKRKKVGPSKKLAEQVLKDVQVKLIKKEYLGVYDEKKISFEDFTKEYLVYSKANKAASTYERQDKIRTGSLKSVFGKYYLFEITPQMIEKYKAKRLKTVSPATVNRELACLKHMYNKAIEWSYLKNSPAKGIKLLKEPPGRLRYLGTQEVEALFKACENLDGRNGHIRPIIVTAINTGMRKSEILNLKWSAVDLDNRKIKVINSKNNEARVIPMNETLYIELADLFANSQAEYVFADKNGRPYGEVKRTFATLLKNAEIEDFRFHDLRHTFASHLVMQGVDLRTVQQVLGHKDIKMTMRYSHLSPAHVVEAMNRLDSLWTLYGHQPNNAEPVSP